MTHEDATLLLHDLHAGRLGDETRLELEEHLDSCESCASLSAFYRTLQATLRRQATVDDHLDPAAIVARAIGDSTDPSGADVEAHLQRCPTCSDEVERVRRAEASVLRASSVTGTRSPETPASSIGWVRQGALAAGIVIALLAYPAYRGLVRLPHVENQAEDLQQELDRVKGWSGAVKLQLVSAPTREGGMTGKLEIVPGQPHLVLGVQMHLPGSAADSEPLRLSLIGDHDTTSAELSVGEAREAIRTSGIVTFLVPGDSVRPGTATLRVSLGADAEAATLFESRLEVVRAP